MGRGEGAMAQVSIWVIEGEAVRAAGVILV